ncbi:hypothetical protein ACFQOY_08810 [Enterococcus alcedinis]|uniref:DUF2712 domain-containing protein n=1 Tax=Enterococcus alcedinis TaxID=1274384 RepID=A0A917JE61_9ENTE|nr:hypothetical protein [Enterococcus alcedinis]MBP2101601.1 hypothetical protein [Enterococcus alcedinis]GGI65004.1 hypothetical protein GCM10011482_06580 [Enterococcus alcedinis]
MKKIILSSVITLGILATSIGSISALADGIDAYGNSSDTSFDYNFAPGLGSTRYTASRVKYDATSAYMKLQSRTKKQNYTASVVDSNNKNFSQTWFVEVKTIGTEYFIPNNAYEDQGYGVKVRIKAHTGDLFGFGASGVWSPDSV